MPGPTDDKAKSPARNTLPGDLPRIIRTRSIVLALAIGLPLSAAFLWLAVRGVSLGQVSTALAGSHWWAIILAAVVINGLLLCQALRWRRIVGRQGHLTRRAYFALSLFGSGVNNVVPGRPGDIARGIWMARLNPMPPASGVASVGVDRAMDVISLLVLLLICMPFVDHPKWLVNLSVVGACVAAALIAILIAAWWLAHHSNSWVRDETTRGTEGFVRRQFRSLIAGMATMRSLAQVSSIIAWSFAGWIVWSAGAWLVAVPGLGLDISAGGMLFTCAVLGLGAAIPASPGLIGTYQWLAVTALAVLGIGRADALAFSILLQATWFIPLTLAGLLSAWWLTQRNRTAPRAIRVDD